MFSYKQNKFIIIVINKALCVLCPCLSLVYRMNSHQAEENVQNSELNKCRYKLVYIPSAALNIVFPPCS